MTRARLRGEVLRPSELGAGEIALWHQMLRQSPPLRRAFFTPEFALACERAIGRVHVGVLHEGATIVGFLPFQFRSAWHQSIRLAERIGANMSDNSGLIALPDFRIAAATLLHCCGLASLSLNHLMQGQECFGLEAEWSQLSYVTDLSGGPDDYFAELAARNRDLVRDTERRFRKAEKSLGRLNLEGCSPVDADALTDALAMKRLQYQRTQVQDPFTLPSSLPLIYALNEAPAPECRLVLARLRAGERTLAQHLGLQYENVLSWWFPTYDEEAQGISPGRLLLWRMIQNAAQDGIGLIDYGEGEAQYKRQFSTGTLRLGRAIWSAGNMRALFARAWRSAEWRLRALRRQSPVSRT